MKVECVATKKFLVQKIAFTQLHAAVYPPEVIATLPWEVLFSVGVTTMVYFVVGSG